MAGGVLLPGAVGAPDGQERPGEKRRRGAVRLPGGDVPLREKAVHGGERGHREHLQVPARRLYVALELPRPSRHPEAGHPHDDAHELLRGYSSRNFSRSFLGERPQCFFTYFPKNERLGKPNSNAISLTLFSECFIRYSISFRT